MDGIFDELYEDITMMSIVVSCNEGQLVEFLEEFLRRLASLLQESDLVLGVGFLVFILKSLIKLCLEVLTVPQS